MNNKQDRLQEEFETKFSCSGYMDGTLNDCLKWIEDNYISKEEHERRFIVEMTRSVTSDNSSLKKD